MERLLHLIRQQWQQQLTAVFLFLALWLFCFPLPLSISPSPFRLFVSRKSLKLILIFDLCQTNLGARHQTAPNRANYINFHIVSCFDTHSERKKPKKEKEKKSKPNRKKSFCQTNEIRKSIILKPPKVEGPLLPFSHSPQVGHISQAQMTQTTGRTKTEKLLQNGPKWQQANEMKK